MKMVFVKFKNPPCLLNISMSQAGKRKRIQFSAERKTARFNMMTIYSIL